MGGASARCIGRRSPRVATVGSYALISRESNEVQLVGIKATDLRL